ncbi:MAG TPA: protein phosphatase 2C domain-containing protein [Nocardioidaceae bacterium]|nr:protein phosphatase 2C domain-containing protein [Nocardioidaceae bacterium]
MLRFSWAAASHVGNVRGNNEDSGFAGPYLLLVADGVGGAAAGEVASASTAFVTASHAMDAGEHDVLEVLAKAARTSHRHLHDGVLQDPSRHGMATTLTAVLSDGERFGIAHAGDSRGYLFRDGILRRLTTDHTLVQQLVDEHRITEAEAARHPHRSVVLRYIGGEEEPQPDLHWLDIRVGDRLLLCSDGLTDLVAEDQIASLLEDDADLERVVGGLVAAALEAGGRDNVTCVVADVVVGARLRPDGTLVGAVRDLDNLIDPAAVRLPRPA